MLVSLSAPVSGEDCTNIRHADSAIYCLQGLIDSLERKVEEMEASQRGMIVFRELKVEAMPASGTDESLEVSRTVEEDVCVLVTVQSSAPRGGCDLERDETGVWSLSANSREGTAICRAICFNLPPRRL